METTMNPGGIIARNESEETITKPRTVATVPEHQHEELVHRSEFRLLLWIGAFVLITISGGFTFLYTGLTDIRVEMANMRVEMKQEHADMRVEMKQELADIRVEMKQELADIRVAMEQEHADIRSEIAGLSERVARVETVLSK